MCEVIERSPIPSNIWNLGIVNVGSGSCFNNARVNDVVAMLSKSYSVELLVKTRSCPSFEVTALRCSVFSVASLEMVVSRVVSLFLVSRSPLDLSGNAPLASTSTGHLRVLSL